MIATLNAKVNSSFSVSGLHCRGVIVVTSTSISNTRVEALLLAFFFECVGPLIRNKCVCLTRPPLFGISGNGGDICTFDSRRHSHRVTRVNNRYSIRQCGNLNRVSPRRL